MMNDEMMKMMKDKKLFKLSYEQTILYHNMT